MREARLLDRFTAFYPTLTPGRWYPVADRGEERTRPEGATRSGGGPVNAEGAWLTVDGESRFVFRQHFEWR